ncbi:MAG: DUF1501 domain-containing protein [Planctomycetaceae bacterium]
MLKILGSPQRLCNGRWTRREMLTVGGLGPLAVSMADLLRWQQCQAAASPDHLFGRAKRIIVLYLSGAASQYETFDPKPEAPAEIRGEFGAAETAVPGLRICDRLPRIASIADRVTIVRSMTHPHNNHSNVYTLTGHPAPNFGIETTPFHPDHYPYFGSVLQYLARRQAPDAPPGEIPPNVGLPFQYSSRAPIKRSGPYGGFLGRTYDPVWSSFEGTATKSADRDPGFGGAIVSVPDPFLGITPESRLTFTGAGWVPVPKKNDGQLEFALVSDLPPPDTLLQPGMTVDRLNRRRSILEQLDSSRRTMDESVAGRSLDYFQQMAYSLISSPRLRDALDVARESDATRERYGMTLFGQSALAGRRLLEAGAPLVTVVWDEVRVVNTAWDTHFRMFERLGDELLPGLDRALSSLVVDLDERGLLNETLVMCLTEHGRTERVELREGYAGRDHSSRAYSILLAGGGIARGNVVGASDARGAGVKSDPVSPEDILATMYHLSGVSHEQTIPDRLGRPVPLVANGRVVEQLLS